MLKYTKSAFFIYTILGQDLLRVFPPSYRLRSPINIPSFSVSKTIGAPLRASRYLAVSRFGILTLQATRCFSLERSVRSRARSRSLCLHARENCTAKVVLAEPRCNRTPIKATPIVTRKAHCDNIIVRGEDAL